MRVIINFMETAVSNQMLSASTSLHRDQEAALDLDHAEHDDAEMLTLWAFRRWVMGLRYKAPEQWETVLRGLRRRCGEAAGHDAAVAMAELVDCLRRTARRTVTHHQPCCAELGDDEATLLVLLAACQRGHSTLAETAAQALSGTSRNEELTMAATRFADAFSQRGLMLPYRDLALDLAFAAGPGSAASVH